MFRIFMAVIQQQQPSFTAMQTILRLRRIAASQFLHQTLERRESPDSSAATSHFETKLADELVKLRILHQQEQHQQNSVNLEDPELIFRKLTTDLVYDLLKFLRNDVETALFLFHLAGRQKLYEHDSRTYNQILKLLTSACRFEEIEVVLSEMSRKNHKVDFLAAEELVIIYSNAGMLDRAQAIFELLQQQERMISAEVYISILKALAKVHRREEARRVTEELIEQALDAPDAVTSDLTIRVLCKTNFVNKAVWLMNRVTSKGIVVNPAVISVLVHNLCKVGKDETAVGILEETCSGRELGDRLFVCHALVCSVVRTSGLTKTSRVIRELVQRGLISGFLSNFSFPGGGREFTTVRILHLFKAMNVQPSVLEYNSFIEGFCKAGRLEEAEKVYNFMRAEKVSPDMYTYNYIIDCIAKAGRVDDAWRVLKAMEDNSGCKPDIITYTRILNGFCQSGKLDDALLLYQRMKDLGHSPDTVTFCCMISGFSKASKFDEALVILNTSLESGCEADEVTYSSIIDPLCRLEHWESALRVFDLARERKCPGSVFLYSRLMNCLCKSRKVETAVLLLKDMCTGEGSSGQLLDGKVCRPNVVIYNTVVDGLCDVGRIDEAYGLVKEMEEEEGVKADVVTYTTFLHAFCRFGRVENACKLLQMMVDAGCTPDVISYNTVITALCSASREEDACGLLQAMLDNGCEPNAFTYTQLITVLCRTKRLEAAMHLFSYMKVARCVPEVITYKELVYSHYRHGNLLQARRILEQGSKAFSMIHSGKSLISEIHEASSVNERRQLTAILSQDFLR